MAAKRKRPKSKVRKFVSERPLFLPTLAIIVVLIGSVVLLNASQDKQGQSIKGLEKKICKILKQTDSPCTIPKNPASRKAFERRQNTRSVILDREGNVVAVVNPPNGSGGGNGTNPGGGGGVKPNPNNPGGGNSPGGGGGGNNPGGGSGGINDPVPSIVDSLQESWNGGMEGVRETCRVVNNQGLAIQVPC
jgi:hypothetical protein